MTPQKSDLKELPNKELKRMNVNVVKQLKENINIFQENINEELNKIENQFRIGKQNSIKR